ETAADPQASEFVKGVLSQQILLGLRDNIFLKKLNTRLVDDRVFILFRMTSNAGLMNYIEFEVKELDDKMKVVDGYSFATGEFFHQMVYKLVPQRIGNTYQLPGGFNEYEYPQMLANLQEALNYHFQGRHDEVFRTLRNMPSHQRNTKIYQHFEVLLTGKSDLDNYEKKVARFLASSPKDPRYQAYNKSLSVCYGSKPDKLEENLKALSAYTYQDPYLEVLRSAAYTFHKDAKRLCASVSKLNSSFCQPIS